MVESLIFISIITLQNDQRFTDNIFEGISVK